MLFLFGDNLMHGNLEDKILLLVLISGKLIAANAGF